MWEIGPVGLPGGVQYNISQLFCEILISILLSNTGVIRMTGQYGSKYGHKFEVQSMKTNLIAKNLLGGGGTFMEGRPCMLSVFCALTMIMNHQNNDDINSYNDLNVMEDKSEKIVGRKRLSL